MHRAEVTPGIAGLEGRLESARARLHAWRGCRGGKSETQPGLVTVGGFWSRSAPKPDMTRLPPPDGLRTRQLGPAGPRIHTAPGRAGAQPLHPQPALGPRLPPGLESAPGAYACEPAARVATAHGSRPAATAAGASESLTTTDHRGRRARRDIGWLVRPGSLRAPPGPCACVCRVLDPSPANPVLARAPYSQRCRRDYGRIPRFTWLSGGNGGSVRPAGCRFRLVRISMRFSAARLATKTQGTPGPPHTCPRRQARISCAREVSVSMDWIW